MFPNFVLLLLLNANQEVLMLRRINTPYSNNCYSLPGGEIKKGETATQAIIREAKNSINLDLTENDLEFAHVMYRKCNEPEFFATVFKVKNQNTNPQNVEPNRHDDMKWFNLNELPANIVEAHKHVIEQIQQNKMYSEHGWVKEEPKIKMRKFLQNKLWRDKMPQNAEEKLGSIIHIKNLNDQEFDEQLRIKLLEEVDEVAKAKTKEDLIGELADVQEVIDTICLHNKIDREEILQKQKVKKLERGGFIERKFVTMAEHVDGGFGVQYCLADPEKYPEIK